MRQWTIIIGLTILYSCQTKQGGSEIEEEELRPDTISITHKRYFLPNENPETLEYMLVREQKGDSILSFRYYQENSLSRQFDFNIRNGNFELIQSKENNELAVVDTLIFQLSGEQITVYKYEIRQPPVDGDAGFLFNMKYGLLGYSAYSWGNKTILTNWNETDFEKEIRGILLAENVRYLRRQEIIPPSGKFGNIEIVADTMEIELDEKLEVR